MQFVCVFREIPLTGECNLDENSILGNSKTQELLKIIPNAPKHKQKELVKEYVCIEISNLMDFEPEMIDMDSNFVDLGFDSLTIAEFKLKIENDLNVNISMLDYVDILKLEDLTNIIVKCLRDLKFLGINRMESVAHKIMNTKKIGKTLERDCELDLSIPLNNFAYDPTETVENILLTGATGFLGAFLLKELLEQTNANVFCLVRAEQTKEANLRIQANMEKYKLWTPVYEKRINVVLGDLDTKQLGLSDDEFQSLAGTIDVIYHNGAYVNHICSYNDLKATNVTGTHRIMKLATQKKIKPVHFISTIAVCVRVGWKGVTALAKEEFITNGEGMVSGYPQSKWVAEQSLLKASKEGLPFTIFRLGEVSGDSTTGVSRTDDMFHYFLKLFAEVPGEPVSKKGVIDILAVDYVAKAIVYISNQVENFGRIYHLRHSKPMSMSDFYMILRKIDTEKDVVDNNSWIRNCKQYLKESSDRKMRVIISQLFEKTPFGYLYEGYFRDYQLMAKNTEDVLKGSDIHCPPLNEVLLRNYFDYFFESDFIVRSKKKLEKIEFV